MPRPEKVSAVADIKKRLEGSQAVFLAEYAGLSVKEQQALRRELRANDAEFKVMKMTLARRAADELELEELDGLFVGPTGMAYAEGDPAAVAKVLRDFAKDHGVFAIKGGLLGREFLTPERISQLADIPPRDRLLAIVAGVLQAPLTSAASVLAALPRSAATVLQQLVDRRTEELEEVPSAAEEAAADEAAGVADDGDEAAADDGAAAAADEAAGVADDGDEAAAADAPAEAADSDDDSHETTPAAADEPTAEEEE